jgi:hypothetical protein
VQLLVAQQMKKTFLYWLHDDELVGLQPDPVNLPMLPMELPVFLGTAD